MYSGPDDIGAVVADIGSFSTRIGYAGEDLPRAYLPTVLGQEANDAGYKFDITRHRENFSLHHPVQDGLVLNWDQFEALWDYSLGTLMKTDVKGKPVLITEKPYNPIEIRHKMCELMFEKYEVDAYFTSKDAVLACYACGKTTGLVVDIGGSGTTITPLQDGWIDLKGLTRLPIGGRYMDGHARKVLFKYHNLSKLLPSYRIQKVFATDRMPSIVEKLNCGNVHRSFDAYMNLEVGREYKENMCRVSEYSLETELDRYKNLPLVPYELPDGTVIDVGVEKYEVPEILFDPTLVDLGDTDVLATLPMRQKALSETDMDVSSGTQSYANIARFHEQETIKEPLHQAICNALYRCDIETHSTLVTNIVLTGGGSAFEGLSDRLKGEIEAIVHRRSPTWRVRILSLGNNEKAICAWLGGSILASLGSFHELWISKQEYLEYGAALVDKKCP